MGAFLNGGLGERNELDGVIDDFSDSFVFDVVNHFDGELGDLSDGFWLVKRDILPMHFGRSLYWKIWVKSTFGALTPQFFKTVGIF